MRVEKEKDKKTIAALQEEVQKLAQARNSALEKIEKKDKEIASLSVNLTQEREIVDDFVKPTTAMS